MEEIELETFHVVYTGDILGPFFSCLWNFSKSNLPTCLPHTPEYVIGGDQFSKKKKQKQNPGKYLKTLNAYEWTEVDYDHKWFF